MAGSVQKRGQELAQVEGADAVDLRIRPERTVGPCRVGASAGVWLGNQGWRFGTFDGTGGECVLYCRTCGAETFHA